MKTTAAAVLIAAIASTALAQGSPPAEIDDAPPDAAGSQVLECRVPRNCPPGRLLRGRRPYYVPQGEGSYLIVVPCSTPSVLACRARERIIGLGTGKKIDLACPDSTAIPVKLKGAFVLKVRVAREGERQEAACTLIGAELASPGRETTPQ